MAGAPGAITKSTVLPSDDELTVPQELHVPTIALRAASYHLGIYCEKKMKEYALCRRETADPRKCLKEGAALTGCGVEFFRKVKKLCKNEFDNYLACVDYKSGHDSYLGHCRKDQRPFDKCALDSLGIQRPRTGYFSMPHVHETDRPRPTVTPFRDYKAESEQMMTELPPDYPLKEEYKKYYESVWTNAF